MTFGKKDQTMIAMMKELSMNQEHSRRRRFPIGARRPLNYAADSSTARCYLQIGSAQVPVDVPVRALRKHERDGDETILLRVPGERIVPVESAPLLSERQQRLAREWWTEMEDFDRF
jgi:hypothetical protein